MCIYCERQKGMTSRITAEWVHQAASDAIVYSNDIEKRSYTSGIEFLFSVKRYFDTKIVRVVMNDPEVFRAAANQVDQQILRGDGVKSFECDGVIFVCDIRHSYRAAR